MTWVYAVALAVGVLGLLSWILVQGLRSEPSEGSSMEIGIATLVGFGLGGMSAKFAGWPVAAHVLASLVAGAAAAAYTYWLAGRSAT